MVFFHGFLGIFENYDLNVLISWDTGSWLPCSSVLRLAWIYFFFVVVAFFYCIDPMEFLLWWGKPAATVALPDLGCMLGVLVFP